MSELQKSSSAKAPSKQEKAINEYLESLLLEVPEEEEASIAVTAEPVTMPQADVVTHKEPENTAAVLGLDQLVAEVPEVITETFVETVTVVEEEPKVETTVIEKPESEIPDWAQTRFQCLLFNVSGLNLAVPLVKLNSVIPWDKKITETPNQTDWYLGLVQHLQNQIKVIDTALLVMPENRRDKIDTNSADRLSHILLVDDYQWGLACSSIGDVIWLEQNEVKWRKDKSSRTWLSGTSLEHLCAIMDTEVFAKMLNDTA